MSVAVLIPYRPGCPHRERALEWVLARYAQHGWPVAIGRGDERGPWVKADAVADALRQTGAEALIVADADVWTDGLPEAARSVGNGSPWAVPHLAVHRLTHDETTRVLAGTEPDLRAVEQRPYRGVEGGGLVVVRRDIYEACPLDPRFRGWGQEDESFGWALGTLHGPPWRGRTPLIHLWHPHQPRMTRKVGSEAGRALARRYQRACRDPLAMRALIEEAKTHVGTRPDDPAVHADSALAVR